MGVIDLSGGVEREDVFAAADALTWTYDPPNRKGYVKFKCPSWCKQHVMWLHKTPSNPNHFREKRHWLMTRPCSRKLIEEHNAEKKGRKGGR